MVTAGVGLPEAVSWLGVYSTIALWKFVTHMSPEPSKVTASALATPVPEIVTAGVGVPEDASWLGVNSATEPTPLL